MHKYKQSNTCNDICSSLAESAVKYPRCAVHAICTAYNVHLLSYHAADKAKPTQRCAHGSENYSTFIPSSAALLALQVFNFWVVVDFFDHLQFVNELDVINYIFMQFKSLMHLWLNWSHIIDPTMLGTPWRTKDEPFVSRYKIRSDFQNKSLKCKSTGR